MAEQWKEIGVNVKVNVLPAAQYWEIWNKRTPTRSPSPPGRIVRSA